MKTERTKAQNEALVKLSDRWTAIGTDELPRPTIQVLAREGCVELADVTKKRVEAETAGWAAKYARLTQAGKRAQKKATRALR